MIPAGGMHIQDVEAVYELEVPEILEALCAARRWDAVNCPVFSAN